MRTHSRFTRIAILSAALLLAVGTLSVLAGRVLVTENAGGKGIFQKLTGRLSKIKPASAGIAPSAKLSPVEKAAPAALTQLFTNEIHYDNNIVDEGERVEIAGPPGMSLTGWTLYFYTGDFGTVYSSVPLTSVAANMPASQGTVSGEPLSTIVVNVVAETGLALQNGAPDGWALVNGSTVVEFFSYEGTFTATDGPANGMTSTDIGTSEPSTALVNSSIQRTASNTWVFADGTNTFGLLNTSQYVPASTGPDITVSETGVGNITNGGSFSFGTTTVGTPVTKTFTVTNTGTANLTLSNLAVSSGFSIASNFGSTTVAPSGMTTFQITMGAAAASTPSGTITFNTNDASNTTFTINISGTVVSPDYAVTTTGNAIVVTDMTGNADTLAVSEPASGQIKFAATGRSFQIDGGTTITGDSGNLSLSGVTSITINQGNGDDTLNVGAFTGNPPSLTINGDAGNDMVNFTGSITFAANANLDVNLQDDTASPGIDSVAVEPNDQLNVSGTGTIDVRVSRNVTVSGRFQTQNGNLTIQANQQATPSTGAFIGVNVTSNATIESTGTGIVSVAGKGGDSSSGSQHGVSVTTGGLIRGGSTGTSTVVQGTGGASTGTGNNGVTLPDGTVSSIGGHISITGIGGGAVGSNSNNGIVLLTGGRVTGGTNANITLDGTRGPTGTAVGIVMASAGSGATVSSSGTGNITFISDTVRIDTFNTAINAGSNTFNLRQKTDGVAINLGSAAGPNVGMVEYSDGELDRVTAGTINVGDANSGNITVSANITRAASTILNLTTGGSINLNASALNSAGGNVTLTPGASGSVNPAATGADVSMSTTGTLSFASGADLGIAINGTTMDSQYRQLNVVGLVNLTGVDLVLSGSHTPSVGQSFIIVNNDSTDAITGKFNGLDEGAIIPNFLGSGLNAMISYMGGDNNDVTLTVNAPVMPPRVVKSFPVSNTVVVGELGFIGFEIFNDNLTVALNGIGFMDAFPAGILVADETGIVDDGGTYTVVNNVLTVSGVSVPAGQTRTFTLFFTAVQAQATPYTNTIASVSSANGGTNNTPSTAQITVNKANTTTTITNGSSLASTATVVGQSYAVNVNVAALNPNSLTRFPRNVQRRQVALAPTATSVTGTVTVSEGSATCTITLPATSCNLTSTTAGAKTITATYNGDTNYNTSNATSASHTVNQAGTTTTITNTVALGTATVIGEAYPVNWSVTVNSPGAVGAALTGNVTVSDGSQTCTAAVSAGTCNLTSTTPGTKNITAAYAGDTNYNSSTSTGVSHTVNNPSTTTTITNAGILLSTPTVVGEAYDVSVSVTVNAPGTGTPTGLISVSDGTGATCSITLPATSCQLTSVTVGAPTTITAIYAGDANFNTSTSTGAPHTVNKGNTTTIITNASSLASTATVVGQSYTVSVSVAGIVPSPTFAPTNGREFVTLAPPPPTNTPTGSVTVSDGSATCSITLSSGAGSCNLTSTTAGAKTITASYAGDTNYNSSNASSASHTVNKASTTVAITNDTPDPSVIGQDYAVTASVSVTAPGAGTPTGTITVSDGALSCIITLPGTSCNLQSTSPGAKTLTATYNGDSNFNASAPSAGAQHTVNKAEVTVTITSDTPDPSPINQNVTVNFTVAAAGPGAGTPTGNVTISDGVDSCTATLAASSCTLPLSTVGIRTLTASYGGDANFNSGTDTEAHTVALPPTIAKVFNPSTTPVNGTTTLTITITNPVANTVALTGVGFTDTFPSGLVIATTPNVTNTCGGTVTNLVNGAVSAGNNGIKLSGGLVGTGAPRTCSVSVNVTPTAQGPLGNSINSVSSTEGGSNTTPATATLLTNSPPTISSNNVPVPAGSSAASFNIATAADPDQAVNTLGITINGNPTTASSNGVTVSNVAIQANGSVTANIATTCAATTATFNLVVTDNQTTTGNGTLTVTITPNMPPMLSYNPATVVAATNPTISPATGPSDNGTFTIGSVSVSPNNGGLGVLLNQSNGVVTILSALQVGNYTVTVPITDNCGTTHNAQQAVTVVCPTVSLSPANLPSATINTAYPQTISASPAGGNYSFAVTSGLLPTGLTLNANGSFSGAPTQPGTFNFRVTATGFAGVGGSCTAFMDYTLLVTCPTITVSPSSLPGGNIGTAYNQTVAASPAGTYNYTVSSGALPPGLSLNASTGAITGTPTTGGNFNFTVTASQGGCSGSRSYTVTIVCATITLSPASPLPSGQAGMAYSQAISASPAGSYTYSLILGSLPSGLTLNQTTGLISGTPGTTGTFSFTVQALAGGGCTASQSYALIIVCPTVTLSPTTLPNASTGTAYSQTLSAAPAGGNYTFAVTTGNLPTGLNLNSSTGLLSGTPTVANSFTFRVTASGFGSCTGFRDYTIVVGGGGCPTITLPATLPNGAIGSLYSNSAAASPAGSYSYAVTSGTVPPGTTLYTSFGLLFGYPTAAGSYTFTVTATQGACTASKTYTVMISAGFASSLTVFSDFDGDGKSDLSVFRGSDGNWLVANSGDGQLQAAAWGASYEPYNDVPVSGDYDGDGRTDLAVFRRGGDLAGYWFIKRSSDSEISSHFWGLPTDVPVPGDYDADGKTDVAVWRGSMGGWYVLRSSDGGVEGSLWGEAGDIPVPGDYDGDGKTDVAVFRKSIEPGDGAHWHIKRSSDGATITLEWGIETDIAVPGDYDGDGKTDLAVWRGSEGNWYIIESGSGALRTETLGALGDLPVAADYDGDGKADAAVWRASTSGWTVKQSSDGVETSKAHGQSGDVPVMARRN